MIMNPMQVGISSYSLAGFSGILMFKKYCQPQEHYTVINWYNWLSTI